MIIDFLVVAAWLWVGYLVGSIPFGWLIGMLRGLDIRDYGSRNIGATNCGRVCGWPWGLAAFVLDVLKGFFPVLAAVAWLPEQVTFASEPLRWYAWLMLVLIAAAPILGHTFPVWLHFRGGKAVATSLGVMMALPMLWWVALIALAVWGAVVGLARYVSVASTVAALVLVAVYLGVYREQAWADFLPVTVFVLLLAILVLARHRANYARLLRGEELKLWGDREDEDAAPQNHLD